MDALLKILILLNGHFAIYKKKHHWVSSYSKMASSEQYHIHSKFMSSPRNMISRFRNVWLISYQAIEGSQQRLHRKDRLPRAYFCYRQLAKFEIVQGICLYNMHYLNQSATS